MTDIADLLTRIEIHKGQLLPDRDTYVDYHFRYACRLLECYGHNPAEHPERMLSIMRHNIKRDADVTVTHYWRSTKPLRWYTPTIDCIDQIIRDDMSFGVDYGIQQ